MTRRQQSGDGFFQFVNQLVNNRVEADVHVFALRQIGCFALGPHVECDDNRIRSRGEQHVAFGDRADARLNHL